MSSPSETRWNLWWIVFLVVAALIVSLVATTDSPPVPRPEPVTPDPVKPKPKPDPCPL